MIDSVSLTHTNVNKGMATVIDAGMAVSSLCEGSQSGSRSDERDGEAHV
jgi:hypothetical protein